MAAELDSGRKDASGVGTGEKVFVSCIIIATTIFGRPFMLASSAPLIVHGELHEVGVGIPEVHAGGRSARARPLTRSCLGGDAALLEQVQHLLDRPLPFQAEVRAS